MVKIVLKQMRTKPLFIKTIFLITLFLLKNRNNAFIGPELSYIAVDEKVRKKGVADLLVKALIAHLRNKGFSNCWTKTVEDNNSAKKLYERNNFCLVKKLTLHKRRFDLYRIKI